MDGSEDNGERYNAMSAIGDQDLRSEVRVDFVYTTHAPAQ
jgi:hypothetical protein